MRHHSLGTRSGCKNTKSTLPHSNPPEPDNQDDAKARCREISKIAENRNLQIIEDGVCGKLMKTKPLPIATFGIKRTILISSWSKTMSVGLGFEFVCVSPVCSPSPMYCAHQYARAPQRTVHDWNRPDSFPFHRSRSIKKHDVLLIGVCHCDVVKSILVQIANS